MRNIATLSWLISSLGSLFFLFENYVIVNMNPITKKDKPFVKKGMNSFYIWLIMIFAGLFIFL